MGKTVKQVVGKKKSSAKADKVEKNLEVKSVAGKKGERNPYLRKMVRVEKNPFGGSITRIAKMSGVTAGFTHEFKQLLGKCVEFHLDDMVKEVIGVINGRVQIIKPKHVALAFQSLASRKVPLPENRARLVKPMAELLDSYNEIDARISKKDENLE